MVLNCSYNTVSALTKLTVGSINRHEIGAELIYQIADEVAAVARLEGVELTSDEARYLVDPVNDSMKQLANHKTSMLQDIIANKPTEIDYLSGYIVCHIIS